MFAAYLIMLREGIEAALIVGIVASYLRQSGRTQWLPMVWVGVSAAVAVCLAVGFALVSANKEFPQRQQELFEGLVALLATAMLTSMVFWMKKAARSIKAQLHDSIDNALRAGDRQGLALIGMVFFAVGREGLESLFFLLAIIQQSDGWAVPIGAALGLASAIGVGFAIYYFGVKLNLRHFFRWTGVFIIFVAAGLLAGALRGFHEAGLWNGLQNTAFDFSAFMPQDGLIGTLLSGVFGYQDAPTVGEVIVYFAYLIPALILFFAPARPAPVARTAPSSPRPNALATADH
jgi:high-affinity iron transporter